MQTIHSKTVLLSLLAIALGVTAYAQRRGGPSGGDDSSLAEPFRGVISGGKIEEGLFKIESTGVTTQPVVDAAKAFRHHNWTKLSVQSCWLSLVSTLATWTTDMRK